MNFSYDYEELIEELKSDLTEGLISMGDKIKIVRGQKVANHYYPIIDYYYDDNEPDEKYEEIQVSKVLEEMEYYDQIIK
ncbi:hypothetical protein [Brevibacillus laterosporus]|uniref:hypothetical protein n=1 Tax=Brevibacillus laterosporus TaxID=1465 RepID=UPI0003B1CD04|nr:hypothetical protein [Brevibacillus laterosporus]ERM18910.1 hypothetical protein P615_01160 [Brevibacillus laterosporus PE36]